MRERQSTWGGRWTSGGGRDGTGQARLHLSDSDLPLRDDWWERCVSLADTAAAGGCLSVDVDMLLRIC
jgi:hypothetical protein